MRLIPCQRRLAIVTKVNSSRENAMFTRTTNLFLLLSLLLVQNGGRLSVAADDTAKAAAPNKTPRILFVTQSFEFKHGAVTRKGDQLSPAEKTMTDLANSSGVFQID